MQSSKVTLIVPVLLIFVGVGWLLTALGVSRNVDWLWTLALAGAGAVCFLVSGLDKFSVVVGTFFVAASVLSLLRQTGKLRACPEID